MGIFEYGDTYVESKDETVNEAKKVKSVTVIGSENGNGYARLRVTIPSDFVSEAGIEKGDTILMELCENNEIRARLAGV